MFAIFAYLDAGSGSILLQAIVGGFAGLCVVSRLAWQELLPRLGFGIRKNTERT